MAGNEQKLKVTLYVDKRDFEKGLKEAGQETQTFSKKLGGAAGILKAGLYSAAAITALKTLKSVFVSTEGGADKFKATLEGGKEALNSLKRSIATADFSNLVEGLKEAYKQGKNLADVFDQLSEASSFANIKLAKLQEKSNKAWEQVLTAGSVEERKAAKEEFLAVEREYNKQAKNLAQATYEINKEKWESVNKVDADYAASVFTQHQEMFINDMALLKKYKSFIDGLGKGVRPMEVGAGAGEVAVGKGYSVQIAEALYDYYVTFQGFADGGPQDLAKIILDLANGINEADRKLNASLRKTKELVEGDTSIQRVTGITGNFTPANAPRLAGVDGTQLGTDTNPQLKPEVIAALNAQIATQMTLIQGLTGELTNMFTAAMYGWDAMAQAAVDALKRIAAEILAKAAVFALLKILFPGSSLVSGGFMNFIGLSGAKGSIGGGLPNVGNLLGSVGSSQGGTLQVQGVISGRDIAIINARGGNSLNSGT